jgi:hypothetical protein
MLTGLIIACEEAGEGSGLRAELPVAGQAVLEHQARLLGKLGAERVIVIAGDLAHEMTGAVGRIRRDGIALDIVHEVADLAHRVRPDERLILLGDGVMADAGAAERLAGATAPAILVLPDLPETRDWELIDATSRWAGMLLADGELLRRTARMLGDWDLQSTLLRNAIQAGAERVMLSASPMLALVRDPSTALAVEQAISRGAARRHSGLLDRFVFDPIARAVAPRVMAAMIDPAWVRAGAVALLGMAALVFLAGWRWPGLILALLSGPVDTLGRHLASLTMRARRERGRWTQYRSLAGALALLALGYNLREFGWGTLALGAATIGFMTASSEHERLIARPSPRPLWLAEPDALIWLMLPFALAGWWPAGLAALALFACGSLFALQRLTRRQP